MFWQERRFSITSVTPGTVDPENAPVTLRVQGEGFHQDASVRLFYLNEEILCLSIRPTEVQDNEIILSIQKESFDRLRLLVCQPPTKIPVTSNIPPRSFYLRVVNPNGQSSNAVAVQIQSFPFRMKSVCVEGAPAVTARSPIQLAPGSELTLAFTVERRSWEGEIPLRVQLFRAPELKGAPGQPRSSIAERIEGIGGEVIIPAGKIEASLQIKVKSDLAKGRYWLVTQMRPADWHAHDFEVVTDDWTDAFVSLIPPAAPSNLIIEQGETSFRISWIDNSYEEDCFYLQRRTEGHPWRTILVLGAHQGVGWMEATDEGAAPCLFDPDKHLCTGYLYTYRVVVRLSLYETTSEEVSAKFSPTQPLPASPTDFEAIDIGTSHITLRWIDNADNEIKYVLNRWLGQFDPQVWPEQIFDLGSHPGTGEMMFTDSGLIPGTQYGYAVAACNVGGVSYVPISMQTVSLPAPAAPGMPTVISFNDTSVSLSWEDRSTDESGFRLERRSSGGAWSQIAGFSARSGIGTQIQWTDAGLSADTDYWYRAGAYNDWDISYSGEAHVHTTAHPPLWVDIVYRTVWMQPTFDPALGQPFEVDFYFDVYGTVDSGSFTNRIHMHPRGDFNTVIDYWDSQAPSLSPGSGGILWLAFNQGYGIPGRYTFDVHLNVNSNVAELDPYNNWGYCDCTIGE